jgi:hypothetical protein
MNTQLTIPFNIHQRENNHSSQSHLEQNRQRLTGKCLIVLNVMLKGNEIWIDSAETRCYNEEGEMVLTGTGVKISSLPRRIKDLKEMGFIEWLHFRDAEDGYRHWFILPENREKVLMKLLSKATVKAA